MKKLAQKSKPSPPHKERIQGRLTSAALPLRHGGVVRIWESIDHRGATCIEIDREVYCNRLTPGECRKLAGWLIERADNPRRKATERRPTKRQAKATAPPPAQKGKK